MMAMPVTTAAPLALPCPARYTVPKDRSVWVRGNIVMRDECSTTVEHYEGVAGWKSETCEGEPHPVRGYWVNSDGLAICPCLDDELVVHEWEDLRAYAERRKSLREEWSIHAVVNYLDRERIPTGYYVSFTVYHKPSWVSLVSRSEGPFGSHAAAVGCLAGLLGKVGELV